MVQPAEEAPAEVDFFKEHESFESNAANQTPLLKEEKSSFFSNASTISETNQANASGDAQGPTVKLSDVSTSSQPERKSTIGGRKPQSKRVGVNILLTNIIIIVIIFYDTHSFRLFTAGQKNYGRSKGQDKF